MKLRITDGDTTTFAEVTQREEHGGDTFVQVESDELSGWVKVSDDDLLA